MPRSPLTPITLLASTLALAACAQTAAPTSTQTPPRLGMPNPASQFCIAQGGQLRIVDTPQGQHGMCRLPDGREVEEWAYFREKNPPAAKP
jgi:putative hemolysin